MDAETPIPPATKSAGGARPGRRRGQRARTIPEQIADHVAAAIVNGEYQDGERLREQELAEMYDVSRGPVREAIRELEKHGLAVLHPRRGAYVVGISLDVIVESFNIRTALAGTAARYFTRRRCPDGIAALQTTVEELHALIETPEVDPITFATAVALCARAIYHNCGASHLNRALRAQFHSTLWGLMWRAQPLDYLTQERRREAAETWRQILAASRAGNERRAERMFRKDTLSSRDSVIATLAALRGQSVDPFLMFTD